MSNVFQSVQVQKPQYSYFDLSNDHKTTFNMGTLVPVLLQECLPSDVFTIDSEAMIRMAPMVAPIMHKCDIYLHHFFVPNRIVWKNWEKFITGSQENIPGSTPLVPMMPSESLEIPVGSLGDYLGLPTGDLSPTGSGVSALPFAVYQRIWFEYYRDQNLQLPDMASFDDWIPIQDGNQDPLYVEELKKLRSRAWEHDYFTSCLPFPQKGPEVIMPMEVTAHVDLPVNYVANSKPVVLKHIDGTGVGATGNLQVDSSPTQIDNLRLATGPALALDPQGTLHVNGDSDPLSTTTTINDLRAAYALQKFLEKNARGGTRYTESLLIHFGVRSSDARLQRPEYIGGSRSVMAISEVLQTSESAGTPQGNMAGRGISVMGGNSVRYFVEEHGFIMTILSVRPKTSYHQGLHRLWQKKDRYQYFWSEFAQLGEEPVLNQELYFNKSATNDNDGTFGYLPRYSEYRYNPNRISGQFHTDLDYWSLHRSFSDSDIPALNANFVECHPSGRIFAVDPYVTDKHSLYCQVYHQITARRPLPKYGNPGGLI